MFLTQTTQYSLPQWPRFYNGSPLKNPLFCPRFNSRPKKILIIPEFHAYDAEKF